MHHHLDGDLSDERMAQLQIHLDGCSDCRERFAQLHKTLACIQYAPDMDSSSDLCQRVMQHLPKVKPLKRFISWFKLYPGKSFASVCGLVVMGAWMMSFDMDKRLVVNIPNEDRVVINGEKVHVPQHAVIHGDIYVANGQIQLDGDVEGDLIVMDGQYSMSPSGSVSGDVYEISYSYERWILQMKKWFDSSQRRE
jgi:hypothetical protein